MPRRPPELRRPARILLSGWACWLLGFFSVVGLVLFIMHHYHQDPFQRPIQETNPGKEDDDHQESLNFTQELSSSTSVARRLVDQMTLSRAYVVLAKENGNLELAWKLSSGIRDCQRLLSGGKPITLEEAHPTINLLSKLMHKSQELHYDVSTAITTLSNHVEALKARSLAAAAQSAALGQLASESVPKNLHCLNVKLADDWFRDPALEKLAEERRSSRRAVDNHLYHFCVFSDNVLATSVVVNSTVSHVEHPRQLVFHVVTEAVTYPAMAAWFLRHGFQGCTVVVRSLEEFNLGGEIKSLTRLRFHIPELHPFLERVVVLEDDVVVRKDLTPLFSLDLHGNVIGAVETCLDGFHLLYNYLNFTDPAISSEFDPQACGWAFGMNVFDLIAWRRANVTARYRYWRDRTVGTLPLGLLAFYGAVEPLDRRWHVLGLGYDYGIDDRLIESAAVVHFDGHMKPWLKLAIGRYAHLWQQHLDFMDSYVRLCRVK